MRGLLVAGLAFGDEGKGSVTDALVRKYHADTVIRYNGGAQAAHNVLTRDGKHHTFAQFGSGMFVPNVRTFLSKFVIINPASMLVEEAELRRQGITDAFPRTIVDPRCVIVTPYQKALNRCLELSRGPARHGSTGMGIGVACEDAKKYGDITLRASDVEHHNIVRDKLELSKALCYDRAMSLKYQWDQALVRETMKVFREDYIDSWYIEQYLAWRARIDIDYMPAFETAVFEGAQGMLLDETWGFFPHNTWSNATFDNAFEIIKEAKLNVDITKIGVLRTYYTRHGAGPFPSENPDVRHPEPYNQKSEYAGAFRQGDFDLPCAVYAIHAIGGIDYLALNHVDVLRQKEKVKVRISQKETIEMASNLFNGFIEEAVGVRIGMLGYGPDAESKRFLPHEHEESTGAVA